MFVLTRLKAQSTEFEASAFIGIPMGDVKGATSAKYSFGQLFVGGDLGYAIGVSDAAGDGGFLARPRFGFSLPIVDLYGYYKAINYHWDGPGDHHWDEKHTLGSVGVGAAFKF